jgi:putative ABC transport system substrate-binding protein
MRRREFIAALGSAAAWPAAVGAQPTQIVGFLSAGKLETYNELMPRLLGGLKAVGFTQGRNVTLEARAADGDFSVIPKLAADLTQRGAVVIVTTGTSSALGAKSGAADIPIVFLTQVDPVPVGLVSSLSHPGGNATGLYLVTADLLSKRLDLARQVAPPGLPIVLMVNPKGAEAAAQLYEANKVASDTGLQIQIRNASTPDEINVAFTDRTSAGAIIVGSDPLFFDQRDQIVTLAMREAIPAIYDRREYVTAGGLMSYGPNLADAFGRLGLYAGKVLRGARPAELPVEQEARFEFVLNLKTARTLGLNLQPTLLALADEVIE